MSPSGQVGSAWNLSTAETANGEQCRPSKALLPNSALPDSSPHLVTRARAASGVEMRRLRLRQPVLRGDLPVERCAQLRRALLGGIMHVGEPETGARGLAPRGTR